MKVLINLKLINKLINYKKIINFLIQFLLYKINNFIDDDFLELGNA